MLTGLRLAPGFSREGAWAVVWKEDDGSTFRDFLLSFGLSVSAEAAMDKVMKRLRHDDGFRRRHAGGTFYPIPAHLGIQNAGRPGR